MADHIKPAEYFPEPENPPDPVKPGRPAAVKFFGTGVLLISLFHLLQFTQILRSWLVISSLPLALPPVFLAAEGLVWFTAGLILFWGVWRARSWSRILGMILSLLYCLENWGMRIWITPGAELAQRWPADLLITLVGLGLTTLALNHPASRLYFKEKPDRIP